MQDQMPSDQILHCDVAVVGAGPAGLMAAEQLAQTGLHVHIFDRMPTPARKFLMAGKSGLNISHSEPLDDFVKRYADAAEQMETALRGFPAPAIRDWAAGLGTETFVGSSGRIFPTVYKASPLLRAWLARLADFGAIIHTRHKWTGWLDSGWSGHTQDAQTLLFETGNGLKRVRSRASLLALGGTSWPRLGSVGEWQAVLAEHSVGLSPFKPANCGFNVNWSNIFRSKFAGHAIKNCVISVSDVSIKGDFIVTKHGVEGGAIYSLSAHLRDILERTGSANLKVDLVPDHSVEHLAIRLSEPRGKHSVSDHIRRKSGLRGVKTGLLHEFLSHDHITDPSCLAHSMKALPIPVQSARPIEEAISVAGGVPFEALDKHLMLKALPGVFCAGEMVDWEAPTGGYLLSACLAQGRQAANGILYWLGKAC